jgi:hypothetical protein
METNRVCKLRLLSEKRSIQSIRTRWEYEKLHFVNIYKERMEGVLLLVHALLDKNSELYFMALVLKATSADDNSIMSA